MAAVLPPAMAEPSCSSEVMPVPGAGAPVTARPVVELLAVTLPVKVGLLMTLRVRLPPRETAPPPDTLVPLLSYWPAWRW